VFSAAARFQDKLYISGPAGLFEYDSRGALLKQYLAGRELPPSPLGSIAHAVLADSREPELVIATRSEGVLAFNGRTFRQIRPEDPQARSVTAVLPLASGRLLLGTLNRGVLVYDGAGLTALHSSLASVHVTALAGDESDLWIGTRDRGVLRFHAGQLDAFSEAEGLPDPQVQAIVVTGESVYVGTSVGVAEFRDGRLQRVLARGAFARALLPRGKTLLVGTMDEGIEDIPLARLRAVGFHPPASLGPAEIEQLFEADGAVFALARDGLYQAGADGGWRHVLSREAAQLSDRNIAALAVDSRGRLWIGYFDRGLDIVSDSARSRPIHVEDDRVFCVNRILPQTGRDDTYVATANGLVLFDASGNQQQVLKRADGLIADHVTDIVPYRDGMAIATPAGLTFLDAAGARSLYAFHGLVNNHVYALGVAGDRLMAGTLGGLSVLDDEKIVGSYTSSTSGLKANWITAVAAMGDEWMVGTYGAGIFKLDASGHFQPSDVATDKFEVNPNAMLVTAQHVFAGSLGNGLYVFDRQSQRWSAMRDGLPSENVTAIASSGGYVYVGTDNGLVRIAEQDFR
jgi:ligand-binding sensor domain-containing protein